MGRIVDSEAEPRWGRSAASVFGLMCAWGLTLARGPAVQAQDAQTEAAKPSRVVQGDVVRAGARQHTVQPGDTLWDLSERYLGSAWEWPRLWSYNPQITNPHWIYPGMVLGLGPGAAPPAAAAKQPGWLAGKTAFPVVGDLHVRDQGYIDRDALATVGHIAGSPEEHMLLAPTDRVYVKLSQADRARPGALYTIFRPMKESERRPDEQGTLVRIFGTLRLQHIEAGHQLARAVIVDAVGPIERGFQVARGVLRHEDVPPRPNATQIKGSVVATLRPREFHANRQVVFVNRGFRHGVEQGNRFFVMRRGDPWRAGLLKSPREMGAVYNEVESPDPYPDEIIAEARAVSVRRWNTAVVITRALKGVKVGDRVQMHRGY